MNRKMKSKWKFIIKSFTSKLSGTRCFEFYLWEQKWRDFFHCQPWSRQHKAAHGKRFTYIYQIAGATRHCPHHYIKIIGYCEGKGGKVGEPQSMLCLIGISAILPLDMQALLPSLSAVWVIWGCKVSRPIWGSLPWVRVSLNLTHFSIWKVLYNFHFRNLAWT
jgi:hypothetical protein